MDDQYSLLNEKPAHKRYESIQPRFNRLHVPRSATEWLLCYECGEIVNNMIYDQHLIRHDLTALTQQLYFHEQIEDQNRRQTMKLVQIKEARNEARSERGGNEACGGGRRKAGDNPRGCFPSTSAGASSQTSSESSSSSSSSSTDSSSSGSEREEEKEEPKLHICRVGLILNPVRLKHEREKDKRTELPAEQMPSGTAGASLATKAKGSNGIAKFEIRGLLRDSDGNLLIVGRKEGDTGAPNYYKIGAELEAELSAFVCRKLVNSGLID